MNSITHSPGLALDLAHAVIDERVRRAAAARRTPARRARRAPSQRRSWPARPWVGRPAAAV